MKGLGVPPDDVACQVLRKTMEKRRIGTAYVRWNTTLDCTNDAHPATLVSLGQRTALHEGRRTEKLPGFDCAACRLIVLQF